VIGRRRSGDEAVPRTEGGEALLETVRRAEAAANVEIAAASPLSSAPWHVAWTNSHCEQAVHDQLAARGFHPYLPKLRRWSHRAGRSHLVDVPFFPGYLFLNDSLDRSAHVEVRKTRGLASLLGERWDRPEAVPPDEIEAIRRVAGSGLEVLPHLYLPEGQPVRVVAGPLAGVRGRLVRHRSDRGLVVISVHLLQRSVSVEMSLADVEPD
jgi:transcription antitermination factor NusG